MSVKKKKNQPQAGLQLKSVIGKTNNQKRVLDEWYHGQHVLMHGIAGTGKTFLAMYLGLEAVFNGNADRVIVVRSALASRDIGFLPGNAKEKLEAYEVPYQQICEELFGRGDAYKILKERNQLEFYSTSFFRGVTFRDAIVIIDEIQNLCGQEISTALTRLGEGTRVMLCGDFTQTDFFRESEKQGLFELFETVKYMPTVSRIEFTVNDICRSGFVREYIIARERARNK